MAWQKLSALALLGAVLLSAVAASEFESPYVMHLTGNSYEDLINDGRVYFVKYYAPWCGHCKRLAGAWKDMGSDLKDNSKIVIAHVDCTIDREICQSADIKGYPTLKVMYKGEELKPYRGARDLPSMKAFIQEAADEVLSESA